MKKVLLLAAALLGAGQIRCDFQFYNYTPYKIMVDVYYQGETRSTCKPTRGIALPATGVLSKYTLPGATCNIRSIWAWAVDDQGNVLKDTNGKPLAVERQEIFSPAGGWAFYVDDKDAKGKKLDGLSIWAQRKI